MQSQAFRFSSSWIIPQQSQKGEGAQKFSQIFCGCGILPQAHHLPGALKTITEKKSRTGQQVRVHAVSRHSTFCWDHCPDLFASRLSSLEIRSLSAVATVSTLDWNTLPAKLSLEPNKAKFCRLYTPNHQFGKPKHGIQCSSKCWPEHQLLSRHNTANVSEHIIIHIPQLLDTIQPACQNNLPDTILQLAASKHYEGSKEAYVARMESFRGEGISIVKPQNPILSSLVAT